MSVKFLDEFVEFRASSEVDAYAKPISEWLEEAKEGGFAGMLLDELIFYAKKMEEKRDKEAVVKAETKSSGQVDGSRSATLK